MLDLLLWLTLLFLVPIVIAAVSLAPWVPTKARDLERINDLANLQSGQQFLEMGAGDGRVCAYIARRNPEVKVIGIELALWLYLYAKIKYLLQGPENLTFKFGNVLKHDISTYDVIYVFGIPETVNKKIKAKISQEMKVGAKLISYVFVIDDWPGMKTEHQMNKGEARITVYQKV